MPGLDLDDVIERKRDEEASPAAVRRGLDLELDDVVAPQDEAQPAPAQAREPGTGNSWLDGLLGAEEGLTLGNTRNLGKLGAGIATRVSDFLSPSLVRDGMPAEYAGERGDSDWLSSLTERAQETGAGKLGRVAGTGVTALGLGGAAGPSVAGQAAVGAGLSSMAAAGETDGDLMSMLAAMPAGAALGAAGGALAGRVGQPLTAQRLGSSALVGAGLGAVTSPGDPIGGATRGAVHGALGRAVLGKLPQSMGAPIRALGQLGAAGAGTLGGAMSPASAQAPDVAYGTAPTMAWAVQSVLSSGSAGLAPEDEQRLTEAVLGGDMDKLISANFALQQKSPAYAARLQRELESLQEE
jgi:hypothetical protein